MGDLDIQTAADMTFGSILEEHPSFKKFLIRCLACIVHHSDDLTKQMFDVPGHDFTKIKLLQEKVFLQRLKKMVTTQPTEGVVTTPTGIPPHVHQSRSLKLILDGVYQLKDQVANLQDGIKTDVERILHERAMDSNSVSMDRLVGIVDERFDLILEKVQQEIQKVNTQVQNSVNLIGNGDNNWSSSTNTDSSSVASDLFLYGGTFNNVPQGFKFPTATIQEGLSFWFKGMIASNDGEKKSGLLDLSNGKGFLKIDLICRQLFVIPGKKFLSILKKILIPHLYHQQLHHLI